MTKKEIKDLAKEVLVQMNITPLDVDVAMDDRSLDVLSAKVVARLVQLKELTMWHDRLHMTQVDWDYIDMTEEEELLSELAKLMTLMNLYKFSLICSMFFHSLPVRDQAVTLPASYCITHLTPSNFGCINVGLL